MVRRVMGARASQAVFGLVVIIVAFSWVLPSFAPYGEVLRSLGGLDQRWLVAFAAVSAFNLIAPAGLQRAAIPDLSFRDAIEVDWVTSAVTNTVPGGSAVAVGMTWTMYRRLQLARATIARSIVVTGVWDQIVKLSAPLVAVAWLSTQRPVSAGLIQAAVVGGGLFGLVLGLCTMLISGPRTTSVIGRTLDRLPLLGAGWPERLEQLRQDTVALVRHRWRQLTFWTMAGHVNLFLLLLVSLRMVGVPATALSAAAVFAALAFGRLVTALPLTPGGLGVMEVGLAGALTATGSADEAAVVAGVLLFRSITFALPVPLGALAWLAWSAHDRVRVPEAEDIPSGLVLPAERSAPHTHR